MNPSCAVERALTRRKQMTGITRAAAKASRTRAVELELRTEQGLPSRLANSQLTQRDCIKKDCTEAHPSR